MLLRMRTVTRTIDSEDFEPILLVPVRTRSNDSEISEIRERIRKARDSSTQLVVLLGLYYCCRKNRRGARPKDLCNFLHRLGIDIKDNVLRAELSFLHRKGVVTKEAGRYRLREDIGLSDIEALVDLDRARAGRIRWEEPKHRDWKPKHSLDPEELLKKYNIHNLKEHIKSLIHEDEIKALATLIGLGGGLRPSDQVIEIGFKDGSFYAIIYEPKVDRYRLICEEYDVLWHKLLEDREIRDWLSKLLEKLGKGPYGKDSDWMKLWATYVDKSVRTKARRIYLAYQNLYSSSQSLFISGMGGKQLVVGLHADVKNDEYYIAR